MELRTKASITLAALAIVGGMFATPAQGQVTIFSKTYSASGGTATDNAYTLFAAPLLSPQANRISVEDSRLFSSLTMAQQRTSPCQTPSR